MSETTLYWCTSWEEARQRIDCLELDRKLYTVRKKEEDATYTYTIRTGFLWFRRREITRPHSILLWEIEVEV